MNDRLPHDEHIAAALMRTRELDCKREADREAAEPIEAEMALPQDEEARPDRADREREPLTDEAKRAAKVARMAIARAAKAAKAEAAETRALARLESKIGSKTTETIPSIPADRPARKSVPDYKRREGFQKAKANPELWERQKAEPNRSFLLFCRFRDLGADRHLRGFIQTVNQETPGRYGRVEYFSRKWKWRERAQAWDEDLDRQAREALASEHVNMKVRQAKLARLMQEKAYQALTRIDPRKMRPSTATTMANTGVTMERTAHELPTEITESRLPPEVADWWKRWAQKLDEEEMEELIGQLRERASGLSGTGAEPPSEN